MTNTPSNTVSDLDRYIQSDEFWQMEGQPSCYMLMLERALKLERALQSISANTCCENCREAALVAKAALRDA